MECEKHETVVINIAENKNCLVKLNESIKSNWEVTKEIKTELKEVQKTHVILANLQSDMNNIKEQLTMQNKLSNERIGEQEIRSQQNTTEIIKALGIAMSSKKLNIKDLLVTKMIDIIVYGSLVGYVLSQGMR